MILTSASSTLTSSHHHRYAVDGKLSTAFATELDWKPYFLWELPSLTKIIGVTITSRNEDAGNDTESINGIQVRAGTVKVDGVVCSSVTVCYGSYPNGTCTYALSGRDCKSYSANEYCGTLNIYKILPLREYTITCQHSILAKLVTVQLLKSEQHSLTFTEISLIRESFLIKPGHSTLSSTIHGSPGILNHVQNVSKIYNFFVIEIHYTMLVYM